MLIQTLVRTTAIPFVHATFAGISGYFIALASMSGRRVAMCALGIGVAATVHGCYDFVSSRPRIAVVVIVYLLFTAYADHARQIAQQLQIAQELENAQGPQRTRASEQTEAAHVPSY